MVKLIKSTLIDFEGFNLRNNGSDILDGIAILNSDQIDLCFYVREPSPHSVTDNFVRSGSGVIDIDASRITASDGQYLLGNISLSTGKFSKGLKTEYNRAGPNNGGRFPTNLILQHDSECVLEGTHKVKARSGKVKGNYLGAFRPSLIYGEGKVVEHANTHIDEEGNEEVPKWNCADTCPARALDLQSGIRPSTLAKLGFEGSVPHPNPKPDTACKNSYIGNIGGQSHVYGDTGGASRFYKQVQGGISLDSYLNTMIRKKGS